MRFKGFEGEWEVKKLGDTGTFFSGGTPLTSKRHYFNGDIPFIRSGELNAKYTEQFISEEGLSNSSAKMIEVGDLIFALYGATSGEVGISKIKGAINQAILCMRTSLNNVFLLNYLRLQKETILNTYLQGGQGNLSAEIIKSITVPIPPQKEQDYIASFLSLIDERITAQSKIIERLETLMQGLREKLFTQKLRFKDSNGQSFPDWEVKKLGEIGETYNGLTGKTKENFGTGKKYIQYKQVFDSSKIQIERCELVNVLENENQNKVQYGDIFFTVSSETPEEIGMSSVLLDTVEDVFLNSFCFGFRPNSLKELNPKFAIYLFRSKNFRNEIVKLAQGSTRYNMSKVELMKLTIQLPCSNEQTYIANFLSTISKKIEAEKKILEQYKNQKKFLLQNLFI